METIAYTIETRARINIKHDTWENISIIFADTNQNIWLNFRNNVGRNVGENIGFNICTNIYNSISIKYKNQH